MGTTSKLQGTQYLLESWYITWIHPCTTEIKYGLLGSKILFATSGTPYHWDFEFPNLHPEILPFLGRSVDEIC